MFSCYPAVKYSTAPKLKREPFRAHFQKLMGIKIAGWERNYVKRGHYVSVVGSLRFRQSLQRVSAIYVLTDSTVA